MPIKSSLILGVHSSSAGRGNLPVTRYTEEDAEHVISNSPVQRVKMPLCVKHELPDGGVCESRVGVGTIFFCGGGKKRCPFA